MMTTTPKRVGRPKVGITPDKAIFFHNCIHSWVVNHKLDNWLKRPVDVYDAKKEFETILAYEAGCHEALESWRLKWLSEQGWRRLQANVRQAFYAKGIPGKQGERERKRTLQVSDSTALSLKRFSEAHDLTVDEAIQTLLKMAGHP